MTGYEILLVVGVPGMFLITGLIGYFVATRQDSAFEQSRKERR